MDDFTLKLVVLAAAGVALFLVGRALSGGEARETGLPVTSVGSDDPPARPATVGYEIPFPFDVRELERKYGTDFKRPRILNYYFAKTDLRAGPADPDCFCDELFVECANPESGHRWTSAFKVATPSGLQMAMKEEQTDSIWLESELIVKRYDLATILRGVLERYAEQQLGRDEQREPMGDDSDS